MHQLFSILRFVQELLFSLLVLSEALVSQLLDLCNLLEKLSGQLCPEKLIGDILKYAKPKV